ncbi:retrovirus-related Pol polyprotein from transposon opus [Trichonephila clavipes]|uniref:Retrovirus-related Pol polyprotein from transposon opus n=1 Tax=Trichonephila clavipes TaxID=2585209 RepID=A0A8X6RQN6_TRICX|nr:retrovirus-related Pol polyprotein from transposon opus [Trichonephila clavipes]
MIANYVNEQHDTWDKFLREFAYAICTAVNETTGKTPAELFLGRKLITPFQKLVMVSDGAQFAVNNWVLIATHPLSSATRKVVAKFKSKFKGPYRVLDVKNNNVVIWKVGKRLTINADQVRIYRHRKCDETEIGTGSSDNGSLRDESSGFDRVQRRSNESQDGTKKGSEVKRELEEKGLSFKNDQEGNALNKIQERLADITSDQEVESRPAIDRKTQQGGPVRSRKGRGRNDNPYIEERTRSSNRNARRGDDQQRQNQEGKGACTRKSLSLEVLGYVKSLVYADKPQTLDHLEDNIRRVIADIRPQKLEKVIENWTSRLDYIRASRGSPMPEIIFKISPIVSLASKFIIIAFSTLLMYKGGAIKIVIEKGRASIESLRSTGLNAMGKWALKGAITAHNTIKWTETLPTVLLGLRTTLRPDTNHTTAQMVYGSNIRLPGEFFNPPSIQIDPETFVTTLQTFMDELKSTKSSPLKSQKIFVHKDSKSCTHVFVRVDRARKALEPPYDGPFPVKERYVKYFTLIIKK